MSISANEIYNKIIDSGIARSSVQKLCLEQALEPFLGQRLVIDEVMEELSAGSVWSFEDQARIRSILEGYEGEALFSIKSERHELIQPLVSCTVKKEDLQFIFDEEIIVSDDYSKLEGYLCAAPTLVARLKEQQPPLNEDQTMENINFYPVYHVQSKSISLDGHYYLEDGLHATGKGFTLVLSQEESNQLISAFESYCKQDTGMSCLDLLNDARARNGMGPLVLKSLSEQIEHAESKKAGLHKSSSHKIELDR